MAGISRYEKIALGLTAAFVLFTGGWFFAGQARGEPYTVAVSRTDSAETQEAQPVPAEAEPGSAGEGEADRPESLLPGETIDINTAGVYDLERLPGIGEKRAQAIVDYRETHGPFQTVEELDRVDGIGQGILSGLRDYVTVGTEPSED